MTPTDAAAAAATAAQASPFTITATAPASSDRDPAVLLTWTMCASGQRLLRLRCWAYRPPRARKNRYEVVIAVEMTGLSPRHADLVARALAEAATIGLALESGVITPAAVLARYGPASPAAATNAAIAGARS